ncbi:MAG: hypothetical protein A2Y12_05450 [Planctomycetes bacterium GWF2_42_9]|nr:MAG: hypothetical protein A2Y12_05450 [Planctomycetes bacterium GWF2_42_9]
MKYTTILSFDMETDIGSWTPFYDGLVYGTPRILEILAKSEVPATFFFTAEAAKLHPDVVKNVDEAGHEIGCHSLCHETLGDEIIPIPGLKPVLPEECYHRLSLATQILQDVLGKKITSFRAPRLWGSTAMVNALEDLGYVADASYPMFYYQKRLIPYHPSREDWTAEGGMRIVEIPNFADMTIESKDIHGRDRDQWPLFRTESAEALMVHVENMLDFYQQKNFPAALCFYMHPWEFYEMPQGIIHYGEGGVLPDPFIVKNCGEFAVRQLDKLIVMLRERGAEFATVKGMAGIKINEQF